MSSNVCKCPCHEPGASIIHFTACCAGPCRWCGINYHGLAEHERVCGKHRISPVELTDKAKEVASMLAGAPTQEARDLAMATLKQSNPVLAAMVRQILGERKGSST